MFRTRSAARLVHAAQRRLRSDDGQTMAEYSVVLGVISVGIILVIGVLSGSIDGALQRAIDVINTA